MMLMSDHWPELELRHLRVVLAIAEAGTLWAAADLLDCSQSRVSQQLLALERIVGERMVERSPGRRGVELTEPGQLLVRHAETVLAQLRTARADVAAYGAGATGTLRVGTYQSVAARIVPSLLREFKRQWPGVTVRLLESATDDHLKRDVRAGSLDLAFAVGPLCEADLDGVELQRDPYVLLVPANWPLASGHTVRLCDLDGVPLISHRGCHNHAEQALRDQGVEPRIVFRSDDNGTVQGLASAGMGVALAALLSVVEDDPRVRIGQLQERPERAVLLVWARDRYRSPANRAFVETAGHARGHRRLGPPDRGRALRAPGRPCGPTVEKSGSCLRLPACPLPRLGHQTRRSPRAMPAGVKNRDAAWFSPRDTGAPRQSGRGDRLDFPAPTSTALDGAAGPQPFDRGRSVGPMRIAR